MAAKKGEPKAKQAEAKGEAKAETIRAFVALELDPMSLRRVVRIADRLRMGSGAPSASWTASNKMHVTLKFMGALEPDAVVPLGQALRALVEGKPAPGPHSLRLAAFPSTSAAHVIVVELDDASGELTSLADKVEKLAATHGVPREKRKFRPHVTLARLKLEYDARRWLRPDLAEGAECRATRVTLYRSDLAPEGATYTPLASFDFAPPA